MIGDFFKAVGLVVVATKATRVLFSLGIKTVFPDVCDGCDKPLPVFFRRRQGWEYFDLGPPSAFYNDVAGYWLCKRCRCGGKLET